MIGFWQSSQVKGWHSPYLVPTFGINSYTEQLDIRKFHKDTRTDNQENEPKFQIKSFFCVCKQHTCPLWLAAILFNWKLWSRSYTQTLWIFFTQFLQCKWVFKSKQSSKFCQTFKTAFTPRCYAQCKLDVYEFQRPILQSFSLRSSFMFFTVYSFLCKIIYSTLDLKCLFYKNIRTSGQTGWLDPCEREVAIQVLKKKIVPHELLRVSGRKWTEITYLWSALSTEESISVFVHIK